MSPLQQLLACQSTFPLFFCKAILTAAATASWIERSLRLSFILLSPSASASAINHNFMVLLSLTVRAILTERRLERTFPLFSLPFFSFCSPLKVGWLSIFIYLHRLSFYFKFLLQLKQIRRPFIFSSPIPMLSSPSIVVHPSVGLCTFFSICQSKHCCCTFPFSWSSLRHLHQSCAQSVLRKEILILQFCCSLHWFLQITLHNSFS